LRNRCYRGQAISITYSECVFVALFKQQSKRMRRIIQSSVVCPAAPYFSTLARKLYDFRGKKFIEHKMCILIFSTTLSTTFLILRRIQPDIIINVCKYSGKVPVIIVRLRWNLNFLETFSKNIKFHENPSSGSPVLPCGRDGWTDIHDEADGSFTQFRPKILHSSHAVHFSLLLLSCNYFPYTILTD